MRCRRWLLSFVLLQVVGVTVGCEPVGDSSGLPYFNTPELTPEWGAKAEQAHRIASFTLTDQRGERFGSATLDGKVHVVSFIYTSCAGICPPMISNLLKIQEAVRDDPSVELVSFTVTPESDNAESLQRFGRMRGIDAGKWHLLTGDRAVIYRLARSSYFAPGSLDATGSTFLHTESVFLIDGQRRIRGVYNGTRPFDVERLIEDIEALNRSGAGARGGRSRSDSAQALDEVEIGEHAVEGVVVRRLVVGDLDGVNALQPGGVGRGNRLPPLAVTGCDFHPVHLGRIVDEGSDIEKPAVGAPPDRQPFIAHPGKRPRLPSVDGIEHQPPVGSGRGDHPAIGRHRAGSQGVTGRVAQARNRGGEGLRGPTGDRLAIEAGKSARCGSEQNDVLAVG